MQSDQIIIELGDSAARIHVSERGASAPAERKRIPLRPVALSPEGDVLTGRPALDRARERPEAALTDLLERVGDPTPCRLGERSVPAEDLLTGALARPLSALCGTTRATALRLVLPAHWGPHVRERVTEAFGRVVTGDVHAVAAPVVVAEEAHPALPEGAERAVVVDAGTDRITVTTLNRPGAGAQRPWRIEETAVGRIGLEDLDDALLTFVLARLPKPPEERDRSSVRTGCRTARSALRTAPATTISLPGQEDALRLVRGDLDVLVGQTLRAELRRAIARLTGLAADGTHADAEIPVIVIGEFAGQPLLVETVSSLLGRPVQVTDDPEYAAVDAATRWDADAASSSAEDPEPGAPQWWKEIMRPQRRRDRDRGVTATFPHLPEPEESVDVVEIPDGADGVRTAAATWSGAVPERTARAGGGDAMPGRGRSMLLTMTIVVLLAVAITWLVIADPLGPLLEVLTAGSAPSAPASGAGAP